MQTSIPNTRVTLDSSTAIKLTKSGQMTKERGLMSRNDVWHRVKIVRGARYDKEIVLRSILQAVEPSDLIPVRYQINGEDAYFMARNCGAALKELCRTNLIVKLPNGEPIVIIITLAFASIHELKINIQPILLAAITRRYNPITKSLTLEDFHKDEEVAKTVYCPLSQSKTLSHTLKLAKTTLGPFEHLNLQHNELLNTDALANSNLTSLRGLDLRYNYLMGMETLAALKNFHITELWLDGNPVCENYANNMRYIDGARLYCPHLQKLDGVWLNTPELPLTYANYFINEHSRRLTHQFIEHYYNFYDHGDRSLLTKLYDRKAVFSMTLGVSSGMIDHDGLAPFVTENRNILDMPHRARAQLLYRGPKNIVAVLGRLPKTLHDRKAFKLDVTFHDERTTVLNIDGIFQTDATQIWRFSRTFVLVANNDNEYNIFNDQFHVHWGPENSTIVFNETSIDVKRNFDRMLSLTPQEEESLIVAMMKVTTMNGDWCRQFLKNANWNARKALKTFMDSYQSARIPDEAFDR